MITKEDLGPFLLNEKVEQLLKERDLAIAQRDAYRKLAAEKFHEVNIGKWGIDSAYAITDKEAARLLSQSEKAEGERK